MKVGNKVAIVTGGIGGIGFATVQYLIRNGTEYVGIFDLLEANSTVVVDRLKTLEEEFTKGKYGYCTCNLKNFDEFIASYEKVLAVKKYVSILVNNAAVATDKDIDLIVDVNIKSVINGTMYAVDRMGKHKGQKGGVVVNIGSNLGLINHPLTPVYNSTKHAVISFVRSMKEHNKLLGVRIVCLCPGITTTNMTTFENLRSSLFDFVSSEAISETVKNMQSPENVASAIVEIIKQGKEGDVWLAQKGESPFNVGEETDLAKMRILF